MKGAIHDVPFDIPRLQRLFLETYLDASGLEVGERTAAYHALSLMKHSLRQPSARDAGDWLDEAQALLEEARK